MEVLRCRWGEGKFSLIDGISLEVIMRDSSLLEMEKVSQDISTFHFPINDNIK